MRLVAYWFSCYSRGDSCGNPARSRTRTRQSPFGTAAAVDTDIVTANNCIWNRSRCQFEAVDGLLLLPSLAVMQQEPQDSLDSSIRTHDHTHRHGYKHTTSRVPNQTQLIINLEPLLRVYLPPTVVKPIPILPPCCLSIVEEYSSQLASEVTYM